MSKIIKNVLDVEPEKVEEFIDLDYPTQYQTNSKDPEELAFENMGDVQCNDNYNPELNLLTVNAAAPMENNQTEENISFHLGNSPNEVERNLLSRKRNRTGTKKAPKQKKDANEKEMPKHPESLSIISGNKNIKNDPQMKNDGKNERNEPGQNQKIFSKRKPYKRIRLIFHKKKMKKKKNEKMYLNGLEKNTT